MAFATSSCTNSSAGANQPDKAAALREPRKVRTARVEQTAVGQSVIVTGSLAASDQALISAKVPGRLVSITVDLGSAVRRGETLARIDDTDYKLRLQQAQAALVQARARLGMAPEGDDDKVDPEQTASVRQARALMDEAKKIQERAQSLVQQGVVARVELDAASASYKVSAGRYQDAIEEIRNRQGMLAQRRSEKALAQQQLADTVISAPFDGRVEEKRASVGEYLAPGAPIVNLVKIDPLRFRAMVPEREAANVHQGQIVHLTVEGATVKYSGTITRLSPSLAEQNRVLTIEADVRNDGSLRPGSFARAEIVTDQTKLATTIPQSAIVTFAGIEKVILAVDGKAVEKTVSTGRRGDGWTEILSGLNIGDVVVVDPGNLQTGQALVLN